MTDLGSPPRPRAETRRAQSSNGSRDSSHDLLQSLQAMRGGDFSVRMRGDYLGIDGKIADAFNEIAATVARADVILFADLIVAPDVAEALPHLLRELLAPNGNATLCLACVPHRRGDNVSVFFPKLTELGARHAATLYLCVHGAASSLTCPCFHRHALQALRSGIGGRSRRPGQQGG